MSIALMVWLFFSLLAPRHQQQPLPTPPAVAESFAVRINRAIERNLWAPVVLEDILGEGPGHWDKDPRYQAGAVNCMTWFQRILAESYSNEPAEVEKRMDRLRYYDGVVSFGTRKHFTEHWLKYDPAPLLPYDCGASKTFNVKIDPEHFLANKRYSCGLFEEKQREFTINYLTADQIAVCLSKAPEKYFALFAVPTVKYQEKYLSESGPMGLVHAMIARSGEKPNNSIILHASTSAGKVLIEQLPAFFERMKNLHRGYVVYELPETWSIDSHETNQGNLQRSEALSRIVSCEAQLVSR